MAKKPRHNNILPPPNTKKHPIYAPHNHTHMAKDKKDLKEKAIEVTLWDAANKLRGRQSHVRLSPHN